ncbi:MULTISPECIES: hypothetical protein [unclassified Pseudofrankia]|uniref:hypothetical protein n=1 Tax=unclassified Pseudofrankia TaxID=2994372 RepID=UPI0009F6D557|nr:MULTISPECIES: hypothetical protein [unclassified Pseudofrankia]MDT3439578.1 hypothetical protein [Pseudofrankia sp. BMG5.37]
MAPEQSTTASRYARPRGERATVAGTTTGGPLERLFLSHRTVGSHLHRIFPNLGVTGRAQLGAALAALGYAAD